MLTPRAVLEITNLSDDALKAARAGRTAESNAILAKISTIKSTGQSSDETRAQYADALKTEAEVAAGHFSISRERHKEVFCRYLKYGAKGLNEIEMRDLLAGTQSIAYTQAAAGGVMIPFDYSSKLYAAGAQTDPLLSASVCDFTIATTTTLQPQIISGFDLSSIEATSVLEATQQTTSNYPTVAGRVLRGNLIYKLSIAASFEAEQDVPSVFNKFAVAYGVGLARRLGADAVTGNGGSTQPQGILTGVGNASYQTGSGKIVLDDLTATYFNVNRIYRASALCGWLMSDSVYQRVRQAVDANGRPLINLENDRETILSKPVYVTPSLGEVGGSLALNSNILFGDLSAFKIRCSAASLTRETNTPGFIETGRALFVARIRMDSALFDPSNGAAPPITNTTVLA